MKPTSFLAGGGALAITAFAAVFASAAWVQAPGFETKAVRVEIPEEASVATVVDALIQRGIFESRWGYTIYAWMDEKVSESRAGEYDLKPGMNYRSIARTLALGPARDETSVTVIEGWTIQDLNESLTKIGVDVRPSDFFAERFADGYAFLKGLAPNSTLEGYLFPDTYRVWKDQLPDGLLQKQLDEFLAKTAGFADEAARQGRSLRDVVILASMVEKEARHDEDRPIIAGIFMNRLADGMRLQSDATLNYVLRSGRDRLTNADLENDSPFNTYKYTGLPPGPICNPSLASLQAALHPAKTEYRYFLTDSDGKAYFARTFEEHTRNRRRVFGE